MKLLKKGRDGKIYAISRNKVMKQFRRNRNRSKILEECRHQELASRAGLSPGILDIQHDPEGRIGVVMERLSHTLMDEIREQNGLCDKWQHEMIRILKHLDRLKIFHGDVSPLNFMVNKGKLYIIDFGMSRHMDANFFKQYGTNPNLCVGLTAFILKLQEFVPSFSPSILQNHLKKSL